MFSDKKDRFSVNIKLRLPKVFLLVSLVPSETFFFFSAFRFQSKQNKKEKFKKIARDKIQFEDFYNYLRGWGEIKKDVNN